MRILFTGGGTGGHFYPIISIAEEFNQLLKEHRLIGAELYYMSSTPYNAGLLFENNITFKRNSAGKIRVNPSVLSVFKNFIDLFKTLWGVVVSVIQVYHLYPDVVFGKGSYASFPALLAAKILRIPVVIHESDTVPGRVNLWAGKFADRIALSYKEAAQYFPANKVAFTGQPVRRDVSKPLKEGAREYLHVAEGLPVVLVIGGSQGAEIINDTLIEGLDKIVDKYAVIHQVGKAHMAEVKATSAAVLVNSAHPERYQPYDYLNSLTMRMASGIASVVVSRAGSTIFEIASWGIPSIIIPITVSNGDHQRQNAFAYARAGACAVVEEQNLSANILNSEIDRLISNKVEHDRMATAAREFYKPDAARLVAEEIMKIALSHEIGK